MKYRITFAPEALEDYENLRSHVKSEVRDAINRHLQFHPAKESQSRIKRLRELDRPQYRLRVGEVRVFYDATDDEVEVLGIVAKSQADEWLRQWSH